MFNKSDITRNACQLFGPQAKRGYDWWWHSFTGRSESTGKEKSFFVEYFLCNPALGGDELIYRFVRGAARRRHPASVYLTVSSFPFGLCQAGRMAQWVILIICPLPISVVLRPCTT